MSTSDLGSSKKVPTKIGSTEKLILNYIDTKALRYKRSKFRKYSTSKEISESIKRSQKSVSNALRRLNARGLIEIYKTKRKYLQLFGPNWSKTLVWEELRKERNRKKHVTVTYRFDNGITTEEWKEW